MRHFKDMEIITLQYASGESIPIELTRKNMKHMRMRVLPGGRVLLSAPLLSPRARIDAFIESHRDWIYTHHFEGEKRLGYIEMPFLPSDGMVYYLGVPRRLRTMPTIRDEVLVFPDEITPLPEPVKPISTYPAPYVPPLRPADESRPKDPTSTKWRPEDI